MSAPLQRQDSFLSHDAPASPSPLTLLPPTLLGEAKERILSVFPPTTPVNLYYAECAVKFLLLLATKGCTNERYVWTALHNLELARDASEKALLLK